MASEVEARRFVDKCVYERTTTSEALRPTLETFDIIMDRAIANTIAAKDDKDREKGMKEVLFSLY
jgi:hypothetical protein